MDFVSSRRVEKQHGWRNRIGQFLKKHGATVFDPWNKPIVEGYWEYGKEDEVTVEARKLWSFKPTPAGAKKRAKCAQSFWETLHVDLRMVDISDIIIAYCPTNVYSVGTPHEIVVARQQSKPVLFVSPPVDHSATSDLRQHLLEQGDKKGLRFLERVESETPIKSNPRGVPSLWYMPLIDSEMFFDGFGFSEPKLRKRMKWTKESVIDKREAERAPDRPLLPFLQGLTKGEFPRRWEPKLGKYEKSDDWLLLKESLE